MRRSLSILTLLLAVCSCDIINGIIHDDEVVARVGSRRLYRSQVEALIPPGTASADSANIALQYIHNWSMDLLYSDIAAQQLTKAELDVSEELEDYRNSLLKFRYEQRYINERLDTAVTREQIQEYYDSHEFANARFARNLYERTWSKGATRAALEGLPRLKLTKQDFLAASGEKEFGEKLQKETRIGF